MYKVFGIKYTFVPVPVPALVPSCARLITAFHVLVLLQSLTSNEQTELGSIIEIIEVECSFPP